MNFYCIVEGRTERKIYPKWIKYCNSTLNIVPRIEDVNQNEVFIITAGGYPYIFEVIKSAIIDIKTYPKFDKFVISLDSELSSYEEKRNELIDKLTEFKFDAESLNIELVIIIQNFCLETWALGHRKIFRKRTTDPDLNEFKKFYNVTVNDPELLPDFPIRKYSRVEFAYKYLHHGIKDLYTSLTYTKSSPDFIGEQHYFDELISRYDDTKHISSFSIFVDTFK